MKILLIKPPVRDFYQTWIRTQPIGLAYIASSLISNGHEVEILDCQTDQRQSVPLPPEFAYLSEYYPFDDRSPFKLFSGFYHFGMSWSEIRRRIIDSNADVFGISSLFTPYHGEALEVAKIVRDCWPEKTVVMGGAHASCDPERVLEDINIDYVVIGEGEARLPLLLEKIFRNKRNEIKDIDGIGWENGEIYINRIRTFIEEPDCLAYPAIDLLNPDNYRIKKERNTVVITSRGCPHKCAYCSAHITMGNSFRARSAEAVVNEMKYCHDRSGIRMFDFEDDNFTFDKERAKHLLTLIINTFGEGKLGLSAMNGVSFASLDRELLILMKKAGFDTINISFVSANMLTKERMNRPGEVIEFDQIVEEAGLEGLSVIAYGIFGMPDQTVEEMTNTVIYLMERSVLIGPSVYYPTPGTPLFEKCKTNNLLPARQSLWRSSAFPIETDEFSRLDLVTLVRLMRVINLIKEKIGKELEEGISLRNIFYLLKKDMAGKDRQDLSNKENIWKQLLLKLFEDKSFYSLRKPKDKSAGMKMVKEKTSERVMNYFLQAAWDRPIKSTF